MVTMQTCPNCGGDGVAYHGPSDLPYEHNDTYCCVCNGTGETEEKSTCPVKWRIVRGNDHGYPLELEEVKTAARVAKFNDRKIADFVVAILNRGRKHA